MASLDKVLFWYYYGTMADLNTSQVKVTLPNQLYFFMKSKADKFGLTTSSYLKNLIIDDVKDLDLPTFSMSDKTEAKGLEAAKEYKAGKTKKVTNIESYFKDL